MFRHYKYLILFFFCIIQVSYIAARKRSPAPPSPFLRQQKLQPFAKPSRLLLKRVAMGGVVLAGAYAGFCTLLAYEQKTPLGRWWEFGDKYKDKKIN